MPPEGWEAAGINQARRTAGSRRSKLFLHGGESRLGPPAPSAVHGEHVGVTHFLEVVRGQSGPETAAAIDNNGRLGVGNLFFNVALDHALTQMNGARQVSPSPFTFFPAIDEVESFSSVHFALHAQHGGFLNPRL